MLDIIISWVTNIFLIGNAYFSHDVLWRQVGLPTPTREFLTRKHLKYIYALYIYNCELSKLEELNGLQK